MRRLRFLYFRFCIHSIHFRKSYRIGKREVHQVFFTDFRQEIHIVLRLGIINDQIKHLAAFGGNGVKLFRPFRCCLGNVFCIFPGRCQFFFNPRHSTFIHGSPCLRRFPCLCVLRKRGCVRFFRCGSTASGTHIAVRCTLLLCLTYRPFIIRVLEGVLIGSIPGTIRHRDLDLLCGKVFLCKLDLQFSIRKFRIGSTVDSYRRDPGYRIISLDGQHTIRKGGRKRWFFRIITADGTVLFIHRPFCIRHPHIDCLVSVDGNASGLRNVLPAPIFPSLCFDFCDFKAFPHLAGIYSNGNRSISLFPPVRLFNGDGRVCALRRINALGRKKRGCHT